MTGPARAVCPLAKMTAAELARYRRELEHALRVFPEGVPVRELLGEKLAGVLAEQERRERVASGSPASG